MTVVEAFVGARVTELNPTGTSLLPLLEKMTAGDRLLVVEQLLQAIKHDLL